MSNKKKIKEHDIVKSNKDINLLGHKLISKGDEGTVVHIYTNDEAYEVEFSKISTTFTMKRNEITN